MHAICSEVCVAEGWPAAAIGTMLAHIRLPMQSNSTSDTNMSEAGPIAQRQDTTKAPHHYIAHSTSSLSQQPHPISQARRASLVMN
jgi:hypothetical protein